MVNKQFFHEVALQIKFTSDHVFSVSFFLIRENVPNNHVTFKRKQIFELQNEEILDKILSLIFVLKINQWDQFTLYVHEMLEYHKRNYEFESFNIGNIYPEGGKCCDFYFFKNLKSDKSNLYFNLFSGGCCGSTSKKTVVGCWAWAWWLARMFTTASLTVHYLMLKGL